MNITPQVKKHQETLLTRQEQAAQITLSQLAEMGGSQNVPVYSKILIGTNPEKVILDFIEANQIDLLIIGTSIGIAAEQLYMGPKVERLIYNAACPVILLNP
jgi:nucleotide-binding universal stress UspA family protein